MPAPAREHEKPTGQEAVAETPTPRRRITAASVLFTLAFLLAIGGVAYRIIRPPASQANPSLLAPNFPEPSDIVFHPGRKTLFVVGDEGDIAEIATDGDVLRSSNLGRVDFEGITIDPATGYLFALVERKNLIFQIDPARLEVLRTFSIDARYGGQTLLPVGADGLEGIAFVPDKNHPEGGRFFVANRGPVSPRNRPEAGHSFIAELALPLRSSTAKKADAKIVGAAACAAGDLSALSWRPGSRTLVAVSEKADSLIEMDLKGTVRRRVALPGDEQEGVAFDDAGFTYVAQDSGGILRLPPRPD